MVEVRKRATSDAEEPIVTESDAPFSQELELPRSFAEGEENDDMSSDAEDFYLSKEQTAMLDEENMRLTGGISGLAMSDPSPLDIDVFSEISSRCLPDKAIDLNDDVLATFRTQLDFWPSFYRKLSSRSFCSWSGRGRIEEDRSATKRFLNNFLP